MAGLFDNLFGGGAAGSMYGDMLSPEQQAAVRRQSMLQMAAKLLESSGPSTTRRSIGQTLGGALSAGAEAMQSGQTNAVQQMLMRQKLDEAKMQKDQAARISEIFGAGQPAPTPLTGVDAINAPAGGAVGPTMGRAAAIGTMPAGPSNISQAARYREAANVFASDPAKAKAYMDIANQLDPRPEVTGQPFEATDMAGNPIMVQQMKDGTTRTMEGFGPKRDVVMQNLGGRMVAIDKNKLKGNESFAMTMTPGEVASNQVARGNLGIAQQNAARAGYTIKDTDQGQMYVPTMPGGQAIPVTGPGGVRLKSAAGSGQPTQDELQTATLLARVSIAEQQIGEAAKANQGAAAPGVFNPLAPRAFKSEERKQVEDAQDEFLDAALTLSTGAAYTQEQFDAAKRTYFPTALDDAQTIKDKANRRKNVIESARLRAGRSAGSIPAMPPSRFEQPAASASPTGLGTGTFDVGSYFTPQPR